MLIDARLLPADELELVETDVCIVGTGPAGLSLAHEFLGQDFRVCVLESGGLDLTDADTHTLAAVETVGDFIQVKDHSESRRFGGNSNRWGIQLPDGQLGLRHRPFDAVDFEQRDWMPYSGWAFDRDHLMPYYQRAHNTFGMKRFSYEVEDWEDPQHPRLPFKSDRITTHIFQFSPGKVFFEDYRRQIQQSRQIKVYLHATVVELETNDTASTVTHVRAACLDGKQLRVAARFVVLATGGIESARLLLASNQVQQQGLGNQHDLVGRFFMDHPLIEGGLFIPSDPKVFSKAGLYDLRQVNDSFIMGTLSLSDTVMRREQLPNISASLFPRSKYFLPSPAKDALKQLISGRGFRNGLAAQHSKTIWTERNKLIRSIYDSVHIKANHLPDPVWYSFARGGWSAGQERCNKDFHVFEVIHQTEQLPHPDNRITLSNSLDRLGRRQARIDTTWRQADIDGIKRAQNILAQEIAKAGLGRFEILRDSHDRPRLCDGGTSHHMGTTRMHIDPRQGVVDPNCKVHSLSNLYIASSSVFPTGGYANPTLTIVALSIRIADRIKTLLNQKLESTVEAGAPEPTQPSLKLLLEPRNAPLQTGQTTVTVPL